MNKEQTLIRLTANASDKVQRNAIFEGNFNDGILIKENSQICLQSCTLNRSQDTIVINSSNDKITFQITANKSNIIRIPHGNYDLNNLQQLLNGIQDEMNNSLDMNLNNKEQNTFIDIHVNEQSTVTFNFARGVSTALLLLNPLTNDPLSTGIDFMHNYEDLNIFKGTDSGEAYFTGRTTSGAFTGTRNVIYSPIPFIQGSGCIKVRLDKFVNSGGVAVGVVIGLIKKTTENMNLLNSLKYTDLISDDMFEYAIRTNEDSNLASPYQFKRPGNNVFEDSTQVPLKATRANSTNNDIISLRLLNGEIEYTVANHQHTVPTGGNPPLPIHSEKYIRRDNVGDAVDYIPYIGLYGTVDNIMIGGQSSIVLNPDPDDVTNDLLDFFEIDAAVGTTPFPSPRPTQTVQNLIFNRESVANFLGFTDVNQNPTDEQTLLSRYTATNKISKIFSTSTYLIEMLSEQLNSYDSLEQGRKSILAPIPISDNTVGINTGLIHYEPNNLIFINMRNAKERLITNMRARIVTNAYEPISIEDLAEINILIRS